MKIFSAVLVGTATLALMALMIFIPFIFEWEWKAENAPGWFGYFFLVLLCLWRISKAIVPERKT